MARYDGTTGRDRLRGTRADDELYGIAGDDVLVGGLGDDRLYGGAGNDLLRPGAGSDEIVGGSGWDTLSYRHARGPIFGYGSDDGSGNYLIFEDGDASDSATGIERLIGSRFDDTFILADGDDRVSGLQGDDYIDGKAGRDVLFGDSGDDRVSGDTGADKLVGDDGDDYLDGGADADRLSGGRGRDLLYAGEGRDVMIGGTGADVFGFRPGDSGGVGVLADLVTDFSAADGDLIDLFNFNRRTTEIGNPLIFIGESQPTGTPRQLWYHRIDGNLYMHIDMDGDNVAEFDIRFDNLAGLTEADFIF